MFFGSGAPSIALVNANPSDTDITPGTANAAYRVDADGSTYTQEGAGSFTVLNQWITPLGQQAQYEVRATLTGGTNPTTGTMGTWQTLGTDRTWSNVQSIVGTHSTTMTIEIRRVGTTVAAASCSVNLFVEVTA